MDMTIWFIPVFVAMLVLEWVSFRFAPDDGELGYSAKDAATSITMGLGSVVVGIVAGLLSAVVVVWCYDHRVVDLPALLGTAWLWVPLLVLLDDFAYYWFHRCSHTVRFLWAAHVVHHSSRYYNLSTAVRQTWIPLVGLPFYLPLFLLGFPPLAWVTVHSLNLVYQFFIHTERIDRLWAPIEYVLNTPSHHRVHHGSQQQYLDRNYGGILIVFDRWFGTFEPERERVVYGLTKNIDTYNPLRVAFHEFTAMCRDVAAAPTWGARWGHVARHPGWRPEQREPAAA